jgi:hypothetical protein
MRYLRHPHVASDGRIAFSYLGDVWIADANGANPRRLTTHAAHDDDPRFSPDGQWIAFTSNRMGNNDIFVVPVTGGEPRQLTWHTGNDAVQYWTPDGKGIVISSPRGPHAYFSPLYVVPLDGTVPYALPMDAGATAGTPVWRYALTAAVLFAPTASRARFAGAGAGIMAVALAGQLSGVAVFDVGVTKGHQGDTVLFSKWNSFSRIGVYERTPAVDWMKKHNLLGQAVHYRLLNADPNHYPGMIIDDDLVKGKIDAAVVWGPIGGYFARRVTSPELVVLPLKSEPGVRMDFGVAMGVRQGEKAWRSLIQQALDQSRDDISQLLREYGIPLVDDKGEPIR